MSDCSLPHPLPAHVDLGTVGGVISMESALHDRRRTLDTANYGPMDLINARLPPELLLQIFQALVDLCDLGQPPTDKSEISFHYDWIAVTHVCRSWRNLALGYPSLWTRIALAREPAADAFLERAGQHSALTLWKHGGLRVVDLLKYSHRLLAAGDVMLDEDSEHVIRSARPDNNLELPVLEHLRLNTALEADRLPQLCTAHMPRLKRLSLECPRSLADSLLRPTLTELEVYGSMAAPTSFHSVAQMLDVLRGLPLLEEIGFCNAVLATSSDAHITSEVVNIPQLRRIVLWQTRGHMPSTRAAFLLLAHLAYPMAAEIDFRLLSPAINFSAYAEIISTLSERIQSHRLASKPPPPMYNRLSLTSYKERYVFGSQIHITLTSDPTDCPGTLGALSVDVLLTPHDFNGPLWGTDAARAADDALCHLASSPLAAAVTHLTLDAPAQPDCPLAAQPDAWPRLHAALPHLAALTLAGAPAHTQAQAFAAAAAQVALDARPALFPALRTLAAHGLDARALEGWLVRVLQVRRACGGEPVRLELGEGFAMEVDGIELREDGDDDGMMGGSLEDE